MQLVSYLVTIKFLE